MFEGLLGGLPYAVAVRAHNLEAGLELWGLQGPVREGYRGLWARVAAQEGADR